MCPGPVSYTHLGKDRIPILVLKLAIPSMIAQFVTVLYSIIDRMFIGNIKEIGDAALAGVGAVSYTHLDVYKRQVKLFPPYT